jgi:hypothetical protein
MNTALSWKTKKANTGSVKAATRKAINYPEYYKASVQTA